MSRESSGDTGEPVNGLSGIALRPVTGRRWQDAGAVDGFTIMGSALPRELTAFAEQVVPILQARGRFRTEYSGSTLRDHLGLDRPVGYRTADGRV